jgi:poly(beta-D-mannuronate) lyase
MYYSKFIFTIGLLALGFHCHASVYRAESASKLAEICVTLQPGDTVILPDGTYTDQQLIFTGNGTEKHPITLRAETSGKVVLNGSSRLSIAGKYLAVDGLVFQGGALDSDSVIEFCGADPVPAQHCVLRNTVIKDYNPPDVETRYFWVTLNGYGNVVENCSFSGQTHSGVTVCVRLKDEKPAGHIIRKNYFGNRPEGTGNGFETIRIGTGQHRMTKARCIVSQNLFEQCNGEIEIISNKSCENTYSNNTFVNCSGTLTLRQGDRCTIENNLFIGGGAEQSGGLRITGEDHRIIGNFFTETTGLAGGAISLRAGTPGSKRGGYPQVKNCLIDNNTFVDNSGPLFALDAGFNPDTGNLLPEHVMISNTLIVPPSDAKSIIAAKNKPTGIQWKNNVLVGDTPDEDLPDGIQIVSEFPDKMKSRLNPHPIQRKDVGPFWQD